MLCVPIYYFTPNRYRARGGEKINISLKLKNAGYFLLPALIIIDVDAIRNSLNTQYAEHAAFVLEKQTWEGWNVVIAVENKATGNLLAFT